MSDRFISQLVITDSLFCHFRFHKKLLNDELIIKPVMQEKIYLIEILIEIYYVWVRIPSFSAQGKVKDLKLRFDGSSGLMCTSYTFFFKVLGLTVLNMSVLDQFNDVAV